tara:strand:+ start:2439 stop:2720 length:282 start_codon:yes stop_codon:yes gene_type:complete
VDTVKLAAFPKIGELFLLIVKLLDPKPFPLSMNVTSFPIAGSDGMNFDSMTKEHCETCVLANQDTTIEDMQSNLSAQIEEQKNPTLTSKTKDW